MEVHTDVFISRYNLKRRISTLPPLSSETFAEKVLHVQAANRLERERATFEKRCQACDKVYYTENAYNNHVGSAKHRQNVALVEAAAKRAGLKLGQDKDETESVVSSQFSFGDHLGNGVQAANDGEGADEDLSKIASKLQLSSKAEEMPTIDENKGEEETEKKPKSLPLTACLFCTYESPNLKLNISHMSKAHGLFIPEQQYLVDLEGLITYLGYKVAVGNQCLSCGKFKNSLEGIQTHMRDKGHCRIAFESEDDQLEIGEFYDFRSTYSDSDEEWEDEEEGEVEKEGGQSSKAPNASKPSASKENGEDEAWETDSDASSLNSEDLCAVPIDHSDRHPRKKDKHHHLDGYHVHAHHNHAHAVYQTETELHLPSGRSVGHRAYARYYRQNLRETPIQAVSHTRYPRRQTSDDETEEVPSTALSRREKRDLELGIRSGRINRRAGDIMGTRGLDKATRKQLSKEEDRGRKVGQKHMSDYQWGVEKRGNMQKHFRDHLLQ